MPAAEPPSPRHVSDASPADIFHRILRKLQRDDAVSLDAITAHPTVASAPGQGPPAPLQQFRATSFGTSSRGSTMDPYRSSVRELLTNAQAEIDGGAPQDPNPEAPSPAGGSLALRYLQQHGDAGGTPGLLPAVVSPPTDQPRRSTSGTFRRPRASTRPSVTGPLPTGPAWNENRFAAAKAEQQLAEEQRFGSAPVPGSLRVVIEDVASAVGQRMETAAIGSVHNCMKYLFETRTLVDKLLKELPLHVHFEADDSASMAQAHARQLINDLKKVPMQLPVGTYAPQQDGTVRPAIGQATPRRVRQQPSAVALQDAPETDRGGSFAPQAMALAPRPPRRTLEQTLAETIPAHDRQALLRHMRRQTQQLDSGTQTEDLTGGTVPQAQYQRQCDRVAELEVVLLEYEQMIGRQVAQLDTARGALAHRSGAVSYLREGLYRECCALRGQLAQAELRQGHMGTPLRSNPSRDSGGSHRSRDAAPAPNAASAPAAPAAVSHTALHSLLDTVLLAVERDRLTVDGQMGPTVTEQLVRLRTQGEEQRQKWKQAQVETTLRCNIAVQRKDRQLKTVKMASDGARVCSIMQHIASAMRADFEKLKGDVIDTLGGMADVLKASSHDLEFTVTKAALEIGHVAHDRAVRLATATLCEHTEALVAPMRYYEYAQGHHPWHFSRYQSPLYQALTHEHPIAAVEAVEPLVTSLQHISDTAQNLSLRLHQRPDPAKPSPGPMLRLAAFDALSLETTTDEEVATIRDRCADDHFLLSRITGHNLRLVCSLMRFKARDALATATRTEILGRDPGVFGSPFLTAELERADFAREDKAPIAAQRVENAKALFVVWRTAKERTGQRIPRSTRDPEMPWAPAPVKRKRPELASPPAPSTPPVTPPPPPLNV